MNYLPGAFRTTKLYEGAVAGYSEEEKFRVTFGLVEPSRLRAMRIHAETICVSKPTGEYITAITPVNLFAGHNLQFTEGRDDDPQGATSRCMLEDLGFSVEYVVGNPNPKSIPLMERLVGTLGMTAFSNLDQVRDILDLGRY